MLFKKTSKVEPVLSLLQMYSMLEKIRYYTNYTFTLGFISTRNPNSLTYKYELLISATTIDVDDGITETSVQQPTYLKDGLTESEFLAVIWTALDRLERHERLEQLTLEGKQIWLPHVVNKDGSLTSEYVPHNKVSYA